jgi:hypothetical protein
MARKAKHVDGTALGLFLLIRAAFGMRPGEKCVHCKHPFTREEVRSLVDPVTFATPIVILATHPTVWAHNGCAIDEARIHSD